MWTRSKASSRFCSSEVRLANSAMDPLALSRLRMQPRTSVTMARISPDRLFAALRFTVSPHAKLTICYDNKQTIRLVSTEIPRLETALKHIDVYNA